MEQESLQSIVKTIEFEAKLLGEHMMSSDLMRRFDPSLTQLRLNGIGIKLFSLPPIRVLPVSIGKLTQLLSLDLSSHSIQQIPTSICDLDHLQHLYLGSNALTQLPVCMGKLTQLRILDISNNQLHSLPDSIINCMALEVLHIEDNPLILSDVQETWIETLIKQGSNVYR
ncbi:MAG: leucine-rich repeat domain-containing protein [Candidatus Heimdallarchaeota archaeon]|nr:leucine-rich repeat domain-containing protein [Candidatus Heimdallarchaeota archaeon]